MINIQSKSAFNKKTFSVPLILFEKSFSVPLIVFEKLEMKSRRGGGRKSAQSGGGGPGEHGQIFHAWVKNRFFLKNFQKMVKKQSKMCRKSRNYNIWTKKLHRKHLWAIKLKFDKFSRYLYRSTPLIGFSGTPHNGPLTWKAPPKSQFQQFFTHSTTQNYHKSQPYTEIDMTSMIVHADFLL